MDLNLPFSISQCQFLQRDELDTSHSEDYFESKRPAYLYGILSKNRISINHKSVILTGKVINLEFLINNKGIVSKELLSWEHPYKDLKKVKVISEYPYNQFSVVDEEDRIVMGGKATYFPELPLFYHQIGNKELLDYEILYIGQSVLSNNSIPVLKRISSHGTFQKILEDYNRLYPDREIFLFFFSFKQDGLINFTGDETIEEKAEFVKTFEATFLNPKTDTIRQNVSILEAALINYFKPKYNKDFINTPPNKRHNSFNDLLKMNLKEVKILFGIQDFGPRLYTETSGRKSEYLINYIIE